jgi:oligopeptide transport system permease protein
MTGVLVRRGSGFLLTLLAIATVSFFLLRAAPGGPFDADRAVDESVKAAQERKFGLDRPVAEQYLRYMADLCFRGDLGPSSRYPGLTVNEIVAETLPASLALGALALTIAIAIGIGTGIVSGLRPGSRTDRILSGAVVTGISVPNFVIGAVLLAVFSLGLGWLPAGGLSGFGSLILPAITLALPIAAVIARLTRSGLKETLEEDYIRTARAKGLGELRVVSVHGLRAALLPVVSFLGPAAAGVLTGSVVVERIFALPGLGTHFVNGALNRDYSLILGVVLVYSAVLVAANLVSDLLLTVLDPRIRRAP